MPDPIKLSQALYLATTVWLGFLLVMLDLFTYKEWNKIVCTLFMVIVVGLNVFVSSARCRSLE